VISALSDARTPLDATQSECDFKARPEIASTLGVRILVNRQNGATVETAQEPENLSSEFGGPDRAHW
jgi:hypothetical protein